MLDASQIGKDPVSKLQLGLAIELAVLPPYLYALWSLKTKADGASAATLEAARTIRSVVYEEMLHAGLVGNLINALNGTVIVRRPPMTYPRQLPGHVPTPASPGPGWVSLQPLSQDAAKVFMAIELPAWDDRVEPPKGTWGTIGQLYDEIDRQLQGGSWPIASMRQLPAGDNPGPGKLIQVGNLGAAHDAIQTIVDQGEGHQVPPPGDPPGDDDDHEVAHYEQFATICDYFGSGHITASDVWPLVKDPDPATWTASQQHANAAFNGAYSALLDSLQAQLGAAAPRIYGEPTQRMNQLAHLATLLRLTGPIPNTQPAAYPGPTFDYVPAAEREGC